MIWLLGMIPPLYVLMRMVPVISEAPTPMIAVLLVAAWAIWSLFWFGLMACFLMVVQGKDTPHTLKGTKEDDNESY